MWRAIRGAFGGGGDSTRSRRRATLDSRNSDWFENHALPLRGTVPPASGVDDSLSIASNPSMASSYNSSTRRRNYTEIATQYFGPQSQTNVETTACDDARGLDAKASARLSQAGHSTNDDGLLVRKRGETPVQRLERKENQRAFDDLVHLANTKQPVALHAFKRKPSLQVPTSPHSSAQQPRDEKPTSGDVIPSDQEVASVPLNKQLNTELLEAYIAYTRSIGHEPQINVAIGEPVSGDEEEALATERLSFVQERKRVDESEHWATQWIGTRFSKRRGCVQFWSFLLVGVVVTTVMIVFLAHVRLNEVLHLDAFVGSDVVISDDFAFMHFRDEVGFQLKYDIEAVDQDFQVLLLTEDDFESYVDGEPFSVITDGSHARTSYASLPRTRFENDHHDEMYLVVQPCRLARDPALSFCQDGQLPTPVSSKQKLFALRKADPSGADGGGQGFTLRSYYVNPMPDDCSASGWTGVPFLLMLVPYILVSLFGLRLFQMAFHCESFRSNLERNYKREFAVPDEEVDYWQPMPWDRKVPKTRMLGPCCWKKMRQPLEPFYTWWRHENYFTWIFFPYRNERLSRGERAIIVFCSLYITFYVTFLLSMLHSSLGDDFIVIGSVVIYWLLLMVLPSLGKAVFKEIFKLIFRQRRKYFRLKAAGGDTSGFSFRVAFLLQVVVVVFISVAQGPMIYIWLYRSCKFLGEFMYFGLLAAVARLSVVGLLMDFIWYSAISTWGWRDLCPYCTERLATCDCFNDELLVLAVERIGAKWELIRLLDDVLSRHAGHDSQFAQYTAQQLSERWLTLVERAETHLDKVNKLHAFQLKKKRDAMRRRNKSRLSLLVERASFVARGGGGGGCDSLYREDSEVANGQDDEDELEPLHEVDSSRERKIMALSRKISAGDFTSRGDSTIFGIVHSIHHAVLDGADQSAAHVQQTHRAADAQAVDSSMRVVFDTPAERLARREDERERRDRAFSVLGGYHIEKRESGLDTTQSEQRDGPTFKSVSHPGPWWWPFGGDTASRPRELLVPTARDGTEHKGDVIVVVTEEAGQEDEDEDEKAQHAQERVVEMISSNKEDDEVARNAPPPCTSRLRSLTFDVYERPPTLWDQTKGQATALVGWLFKYDSSQY